MVVNKVQHEAVNNLKNNSHGSIAFHSVLDEEVKYVLVSCTVFTNYLMKK